MEFIELETIVTEQNFNEQGYLTANPDVALAVKEGLQESGRHHFELHGKNEARKIFLAGKELKELQKRKLKKIKTILRDDIEYVSKPGCYDFLTKKLRKQFNILDAEYVSSHGYDKHALDLVNEKSEGLVLDCGAGQRPIYYENVVNFEIVNYVTTDVRGVGEVLPFIDDAFDAVLSMSVLEHVKDPFLCGKEIARVLKPGGKLICSVPFLQPLHGYPYHYYNMSHKGLQNIFSDYLQIDKVSVYKSVAPIWSLTWILQSWADGLQDEAEEQFLQMQIGDFVAGAFDHLQKPYVTELSEEKNFELASATVLFAHKI